LFLTRGVLTRGWLCCFFNVFFNEGGAASLLSLLLLELLFVAVIVTVVVVVIEVLCLLLLPLLLIFNNNILTMFLHACLNGFVNEGAFFFQGCFNEGVPVLCCGVCLGLCFVFIPKEYSLRGCCSLISVFNVRSIVII